MEYTFGPFRLEADGHVLYRDGNLVPLAPKAVEILVALLQSQGQLVSKEDLLQQVWPDTFVEEHNLVHYISQLRKVLADGNGTQPLIETIPKRGYRFVGAVQRNGPEKTSSVPPDADDAGIESGSAPAYRKHFRFLILISVPLLLAVLLGAVVLHGVYSHGPGIARTEFARLTDAPGAELYASLSPDGKTFLYASRASGNWDIYSRRVAGSAALNLTTDSPDDDTQPAFSPDGEFIAFRSSRQGGGIYVMGAMGDAPRRVTTFGYHPAWSPNGKELVFASSPTEAPEVRYPSELWVADVASGSTRKLRDSGYHPSWSPDGRWIAYWDGRATGRRDMFLIPPTGGKPVQITNDLYLNWNPVWSPVGDYLYFASNRGGSMNLWRLRIDSAAGRPAGPPEPLTTPSPYIGYISISADGSRIAYISQVRTYNLYRIPFDPSKGSATGPPRPVTQGLMQAAYPDVSPDGNWLAFTSWEKDEDIIVMRTDGTALRRITNDAFLDRGARWSQDGSRITFQSNRSGISEVWSVSADGGGMRQLTSAGGVSCPVLSPDGSRLVYTKGSVGAYVMDLVSATKQQPPRFLRFSGEPGEWFRGTSWSPDGRRLAGYIHRSDNTPAGVAVYSFDSSAFEKLVNFGESPLWLNDGRRLLFQLDGVIYLLDARSKEVQQVASVRPNTIYDRLAVSPDNRWIYLSLINNEADVWSMMLR